MPTNCGKNKDAWERWKEREERKGCSYILISNIYIISNTHTHIYIQLKYKKHNYSWAYKEYLTNVLYRLISPSSPLRLCSNFTIGTLAVVIGRMFLKPEGEGAKS